MLRLTVKTVRAKAVTESSGKGISKWSFGTILYTTFVNHGVGRGNLVADYDWLLYTLLGAAAVIIAFVVLYATRMRKPKVNQKLAPAQTRASPSDAWSKRFSLTSGRTVSVEQAKEAKDSLKTLDLEREILSYAIRRLYEAQAEGKISEEERERIAQRYKSRMMKVRDSMSKSESVVALHELESMQEDLVKLFSERFDDLGTKVEELRTRLEIKAEKEEKTAATLSEIPLPQMEETTPRAADREKEKKKARRKSSAVPAPRTGAEKRIEEIRTEVEKVLERLGQMEVEGES